MPEAGPCPHDVHNPELRDHDRPQQVDYHDVLRVWREADAIPEIEHAWLFDHLMPIGGDPDGPILEGWTLLSALAAPDPTAAPRPAGHQQPVPPARDAGQDRHHRRHRLRRAARLRHRRRLAAQPPAGPARVRGARPAVPRLRARRRQPRRGLHGDPAAVDRGRAVRLRTAPTSSSPGAFGNPKPVQRPHPPIIIGGRSAADAARGRRARRPVEHPRRRHRRRRRAAARCWTATAPRSAATPPRSPARSTCRSPTTGPTSPGTRSARRSTPASGTSSSGCPRPTPPSVARWVADELVKPSV